MQHGWIICSAEGWFHPKQSQSSSGSREMLIVSDSQTQSFGTEPRALTTCDQSSATLSRQTPKSLCPLSWDSHVTNTMCWKGQVRTSSLWFVSMQKRGREQMEQPGTTRGGGPLDLKRLPPVLLGHCWSIHRIIE